MAEVSSTSSEREQQARWYSGCPEEEDGGESLFDSASEEVMVRSECKFPMGGVTNKNDIKKVNGKDSSRKLVVGCKAGPMCLAVSHWIRMTAYRSLCFNGRLAQKNGRLTLEAMSQRKGENGPRDTVESEVFLTELWMPGVNEFVSCIHPIM